MSSITSVQMIIWVRVSALMSARRYRRYITPQCTKSVVVASPVKIADVIKMPRLVTVDSRLPPTSAPENSPENPKKVNKDLQMVEAQTTADTRYDVQGNLREPFEVQGLPGLAIITTAIVIALVILIFPQPLPVRVGLGVGVIYGIHYILGKYVK